MVTRVAIVEDNPKFLEKLVNLVAAAPDFSIFGIALDGRSGLDLIKQGEADLYLIDLGLPYISGTELIRQVVASHPAATIMVVTVFGDDTNILASIEAGATGYVLKDDGADRILDGMRNLLKGEAWLSPTIAIKILQRLRTAPPPLANGSTGPVDEAAGKSGAPAIHLTKREIEILKVLAKGLSFAEISQALFISTHTVAQHIKNIYRKLAVNSRGEAVYAANKMGLID